MIVPGSANSLLLAQGASTGYNLTKSLRTRASASAYLNRTIGTPTAQNTWTYSVWIKRGQLGIYGNLLSSNGTQVQYLFYADDTLQFYVNNSTTIFATTQVFRDPSAWYHLVLSVNSSATGTDKAKLYVNGVQVTSFSTDNRSSFSTSAINQSGTTNQIGCYGVSTSNFFDGYITEINFVDGQQLTASSFGENNADTGVWQPIAYTGTYGTNGYYLPFTDTSSASPTGLGKDFSGTSSNVIVGSATNASTTLTVVSTTGISVGNIVTGTGIPSNTYVTAIGVLQVTLSQAATATTVSNNYTFSGNNWTCNNISLTAGSTYDSMTDVPTLTSATTANYAVLNPLFDASVSNSNGNLQTVLGTGTISTVPATMGFTSGKYYCEITYVATGASGLTVGVTQSNLSTANQYNWGAGGVGYRSNNGNSNTNGAGQVAYGATWTTGDVIGIAVDTTANTITFYKNGTSQGALTLPTLATGASWLYSFSNITSAGTQTMAANFGQQPFTYTPPTGYVALNTYNLPTSTIVKGNTVMDATTYTGTGASLSVTNAGFKPDLVWIKSRSAATDHKLTDSVRGTTKALISDTTGAETTDANGLTAFGTSGFTVGTDTVYNNNTATYVGWQWQAGQGTTSTNNDGNRTSTVSVNATAGFSVVTYTFSTSGTNTVGHGLGVAPAFIIMKDRTNAYNWDVYHQSVGYANRLVLNSTAAAAPGFWASTPTSTTFAVTSSMGSNNDAIVAYCWAEIAGFSKFGSYTGNASSDGPFIYTGFRPAYVLIKRTDTTENWVIFDNARNPYNVEILTLEPNLSAAEGSSSSNAAMDLVSNGFKIRCASGINTGTWIYAAFAENPFKNALAR